MIKEYEKIDPEIKLRRSGRTTANALLLISEALSNPGEQIKLFDHSSNERHVLLNVTFPTIYSIIKKLELEGFTFNKTKLTIRFDLEE